MAGSPVALKFLKACDVGIDHHCDKAVEVETGFPSQDLAGFRGVTQETIHLGRADQRGINLDILLPVEPGMVEGSPGKVSHRVRLAGRNDKILGVLPLQASSR